MPDLHREVRGAWFDSKRALTIFSTVILAVVLAIQAGALIDHDVTVGLLDEHAEPLMAAGFGALVAEGSLATTTGVLWVLGEITLFFWCWSYYGKIGSYFRKGEEH